MRIQVYLNIIELLNFFVNLVKKYYKIEIFWN